MVQVLEEVTHGVQLGAGVALDAGRLAAAVEAQVQLTVLRAAALIAAVQHRQDLLSLRLASRAAAAAAAARGRRVFGGGGAAGASATLASGEFTLLM